MRSGKEALHAKDVCPALLQFAGPCTVHIEVCVLCLPLQACVYDQGGLWRVAALA